MYNVTNSDTVGASWHGFSDRDSGMAHYMWCVQTQSSNQPCDVRDWENNRTLVLTLCTLIISIYPIKLIMYNVTQL
jgi:hypothetical protein